MAKKVLLMTAEYLRSVVRYDSETGQMFWIATRGSNAKAGQIAGKIRKKDGYRDVKIDGKMYLVHRLAWLYVFGQWPIMIDHINMNRSDNRLVNLRECNQSMNSANRCAQSNNKCGLKGVHKVAWTSGNIRWKAQIYITKNKHKQIIYLGCFETKEEAHEVYRAKARELFGEFARG